MSIYGSWPAPDDDHHEEACAVWAEDPPGSGIAEWTGEPCSCAMPRAPIVYQGSHVLPAGEDTPWPFLRLGVNEGTVVLDRAGVELVHRTLGEWLRCIGAEQP